MQICYDFKVLKNTKQNQNKITFSEVVAIKHLFINFVLTFLGWASCEVGVAEVEKLSAAYNNTVSLKITDIVHNKIQQVIIPNF